MKAFPIVLLFVWIFASPALASDPKALLEELKHAYGSTQDISARFTQTTTLKAVDMERVNKGTVVFKKGGKMRWLYEGDDPQEIVSDGSTLWVHQVRDHTAVKRRVGELSPAGRLALDLLGGFEGVEAQFQAVSCGERCVELTPKRPDPDLAKVKVELVAGGAGVKSVTTEDPVGNITKVELSELRTNTKVKDDAFVFTPPKGVDVVDSDAGGKK